MARTAKLLNTQRHEAIHAVAIFTLFGPESVGRVSRKEHDGFLGKTTVAGLPHRHPSLNAADGAVIMLAPLLDPSVSDSGCDSDVEHARECAEIAYKYRPDHERSMPPDEWVERWMHGPVRERTVELLEDSLLRARVRALEHALDYSAVLEAHEVREVLENVAA